MSLNERLQNDHYTEFDKKLKTLLILFYILTPFGFLFTLFLFGYMFNGANTFFVGLLSLSLNICMYTCIVLIGFARKQIAQNVNRKINPI